MQAKYPALFDFEGNAVKLIYLKGENKPYYNAISVASALGRKNPSGSALSAVDTVCEKIRNYAELSGRPFIEGTKVEIANSAKQGKIAASDGVMTVISVARSSRATAHSDYFYNQEALYEVLLTSSGDAAIKFRYWVTHDVLPSIAEYGEYITARGTGIVMRRCLTDAIKLGIDHGELDEDAYSAVTDAVYFIRYGRHSNELRAAMMLDASANIREHLPKDELHVLADLESKLAAYLTIGMTLEQVTTNKRLLALYRKAV